MELAATIDAAKVFCQKTYTVEGDGVLATEVYSHLQELATAAADGYYPNVIQVMDDIAQDNAVLRQ